MIYISINSIFEHVANILTYDIKNAFDKKINLVDFTQINGLSNLRNCARYYSSILSDVQLSVDDQSNNTLYEKMLANWSQFSSFFVIGYTRSTGGADFSDNPKGNQRLTPIR